MRQPRRLFPPPPPSVPAVFHPLKTDTVTVAMLWFPPVIVLSPVKRCSGKSVTAPDSEPAKPPVNLEEIRAELKAKIEEEAYNKG